MRSLAVLAALFAVSLADCGVSPSAQFVAASRPGAASSSTLVSSSRPAAATLAPAKSEQVQLYFSRRGRLVRERASVDGEYPARAALTLLLNGPRVAGHYNEIPKTSRLLGMRLEGTVADANFNAAFFAPGSATGTQLRLAQVVYTLTQFPTIRSVQFLENGKLRSVVGEGFPIARPLTRRAFAAVAALPAA